MGDQQSPVNSDIAVFEEHTFLSIDIREEDNTLQPEHSHNWQRDTIDRAIDIVDRYI